MVNAARNKGFRPQLLAMRSDQQGDRQHYRLRRDNARRHHGGRLFGKLGRQFLTDQRQQRRIGEVEEHYA